MLSLHCYQEEPLSFPHPRLKELKGCLHPEGGLHYLWGDNPLMWAEVKTASPQQHGKVEKKNTSLKS